MSANFSHLPAETQAMLADRYGIKDRKSWRLIAILVALIGLTIALFIIAIRSKSEVIVNENELLAGGAHIDLKYLGYIETLSRDQLRLLRTRDADPASFLAIKFWAPKGIKIEIADPRDPTPYWLVTSKRGEELAASLIN